jgi:hypothetical protein
MRTDVSEEHVSSTFRAKRTEKDNTRFYADSLFGLFHPENGDDKSLLNVGWLSTHYTTLHLHNQPTVTVIRVRLEALKTMTECRFCSCWRRMALYMHGWYMSEIVM